MLDPNAPDAPHAALKPEQAAGIPASGENATEVESSIVSAVAAFNAETPQKKRKKMATGGGGAVPKELTAEQKAIVKMNVTRETTSDGVVKCCYCDKEITSKNVDRWASHLRGCIKAPSELKAQIQPFRAAATTTIPPPNVAMSTGFAAHNASPVTMRTAGAPGGSPSAVAAGTGTATHGMPITANSGAVLGATVLANNGFNETFKVHVAKDYMKFNAAHFIAYKGYREKLHGHNYHVSVTISGVIGPDGYVVDFSEIKKIARVVCKDLNETFLVPMNSDVLKITFDGTNVHILTEDSGRFSFPKSDCSLLPIVHTSAEELAIYISNQIVDAFSVVMLIERGVRKLEVSVAEAKAQYASYERSILPTAATDA